LTSEVCIVTVRARGVVGLVSGGGRGVLIGRKEVT
jgi:hypothetical protein